MIMNAAIEAEMREMDRDGIEGIEEIKDTKVLKIIDKCCSDMLKWGYKIPKDIKWACARMDPMGKTLIYVDDDVHLRSTAILLNSGLKELSSNDIKDTVYHELIHAITGKDHEDAAWQAAKKDVASRTKLKIQEVVNINNIKLPRSYWIMGSRYVFCCEKCGITVGFSNPRKYPIFQDLVDHCGEKDPVTGMSRFTHTGCGGSWKRER